MPELPEVETTLRGIKRELIGQKVMAVIIRQPRLRFPIPSEIEKELKGQVVENIERRAKYLLFKFKTGTLILHLGMSGRLCVLQDPPPPQKHDHVDIHFANHFTLRLTDPRRFGALLFTSSLAEKHPFLINLGPEPLTDQFDGDYLFNRSRGRKLTVKSYLMDGRIVVGVGNIYAAEALFLAKINPQKPAGKITRVKYQTLAKVIKSVLQSAIQQGGTTLKDFKKPSGQPGYFRIALQVYGRAGKPCTRCKSKLTSIRIGQRNTVYCPRCQKN